MKKTKADKTKGGQAGEATAVAQVAGGATDETAGPGPAAPAGSEKSAEAVAAAAPPETDNLIAELQAKAEKLEDSLYRAKADFQNLQRRSAIERGEAVCYANAELIKALLPVVDDFERALAAAEESGNLEAVVAGVRLVYNNLAKALRDHGLETIEALHRPFDPGVHEAILQTPSADYPPGTVVEQLARGYRLRDRVLRPARVIVSKAAENEGPTRDREDAAGEGKIERGTES